ALVRKTRKAKKAKAAEIAAGEIEDYEEYQGKSYWALLGLILLGCIGLYFGADWFVSGASEIALSLGVSEHIIGVTLVAFGTSVPELVASCIAAFKKETDISIGNLVGSNIFNLLAVMGITSLVKPLAVDPLLLTQDIWWMLGISALLLPLMFIGGKVINRFKGLIFLALYITYIVVVLL
ncbi:MAG: sodium:calcium antiporter, partial [Flavobacteriales bacterium]